MSFSIRPEYDDKDRRFIEGLNVRLTEVIKAPAHSSNEIESFQKAFTATAWELDGGKARPSWRSKRPATGSAMSMFVKDRMRSWRRLAATSRSWQSSRSMKAEVWLKVEQAELWAREMGFSRLALDVFASNDHALNFYDRAGFRPETIRVIKRL